MAKNRKASKKTSKKLTKQSNNKKVSENTKGPASNRKQGKKKRR